ncbi:MAG TPA: hypothetical protein VF988_10610 [Verrucomicrobiae bacterium]
MTDKRAMTFPKTRFYAGGSSFSPAALVARLLKNLTFEIPIGYQDESGFHYGEEPRQKKSGK